MRRKNFFSKAMIVLLTVSMSIFIFAGCQSKDTNESTQATNSSTQNSKKPDPEQMKKRMQENIQPLVADGTITQSQADKIVEAFTTNTRQKGSQGSAQNNQQNNSQNNQQSNNQQNNNQKNGQNRPRNNALSKLVSDGVITQAQADAVMKKIGGNFSHKNKGQDSNNKGQSSSNNGQTSNQ